MDESTSGLVRKLRGYPDTFGDEELEHLRDLIDEILTGRAFFDYPAGKHVVDYQKEVIVDESGKVTVKFNREDKGITIMSKCLAAHEARLTEQKAIRVKERNPPGYWNRNLDGAPNLEATRERLEELGHENINTNSPQNMRAVNLAIRGSGTY
jgi:hypothetical protein